MKQKLMKALLWAVLLGVGGQASALVTIQQANYPALYGTAAERAAIATPVPYSVFYETDTLLTYKYLGSWIAVTTSSLAVTVSDPSVVAAITAAALTPGAALIGGTSTSKSSTITLGGTAQTLAGGTPVNGFEVCNPGTAGDIWVSDIGTALANGSGSYRVAANGGCYSPPTGSKPISAISVVGGTTSQVFTARVW